MGSDSGEISSRFRKLLPQFSQAEIARRCDIPASNISRYVNGQRIPAEVCSSLVRCLGVNPLWLLTGEGPVFGAQVDEASKDAATGLRRLLDQLSHTSVRAIDSVPKSLEGSSLAELRRDLSHLNEVQTKLHGHVHGLYEELLEELIGAMDSGVAERGQQILQQLRDLETVSPDPAMMRQRRNLEAVMLLEENRKEEALALQREIFSEAMSNFGDVGKTQLMQEFNFIATLRSCGYFTEARAYARALTELRRPLEQLPEYWLLLVLGAFLEIELGQLAAGLQDLSRSLAHVPDKYRNEHYSLVICTHLLQGTLTLESARASEASRVESRPANERAVSAISLLRFAICADSTPTILKVMAEFDDLKDGFGRMDDPCLRFAEAIVSVDGASSTSADALRRMESIRSDSDEGDGNLHRVEHIAYATRFALLNELPTYSELWQKTDEAIEALKENQIPRLLTRWLHARSTIRVADATDLPSEQLIASARKATLFLAEYVAKGYVAFNSPKDAISTGEEVA